MTDVLDDVAVANLQAELDSVRRELSETMSQLTTVRAYRDQLAREVNSVRDRFRSDVELIGETFKDDYVSGDAVDTYQELIDRINGRLLYDLPDARRSFTVDAQIRVNVTVEATDSDDARNIAFEVVRDIESTIDSGNWGELELSATAYPESKFNFTVSED